MGSIKGVLRPVEDYRLRASRLSSARRPQRREEVVPGLARVGIGSGARTGAGVFTRVRADERRVVRPPAFARDLRGGRGSPGVIFPRSSTGALGGDLNRIPCPRRSAAASPRREHTRRSRSGGSVGPILSHSCSRSACRAFRMPAATVVSCAAAGRSDFEAQVPILQDASGAACGRLGALCPKGNPLSWPSNPGPDSSGLLEGLSPRPFVMNIIPDGAERRASFPPQPRIDLAAQGTYGLRRARSSPPGVRWESAASL